MAIEALRKLVKKEPDLLEAWVEMAFQQEMDKDYAAAVGTYTQILQLGSTREDIRQRIENGGGRGPRGHPPARGGPVASS